MNDLIFDFLLYLLQLAALTLGVVAVCGFAVRLCARAFSALIGGGAEGVFDLTAVIGTPIHELGHALMCPLFGHRITRMQLWSPTAKNGVYGYVEHSYNRKNPWAQLGNLFIGLGPIFSGLGVTVLVLWLCFPAQWASYLATSRALVAAGAEPIAIARGVISLLGDLPHAFAAGWWRPLLGLLVILPVSLHISLSAADVRGSLGAFPIYALMLAVFGAITYFAGVSASILSGLYLWNLWLLSLFCLVIAFAAVWVVIALAVWLIRRLVSFF